MTRSQVAASARAAAEEALDRMRSERFDPTGELFKPSTINHAVAVRDTHFADLLANGDRFAHLNQFGQVVFDRMYGHAGHDHGLAGRLTALCQRNAEQPCGFDGIVVKKLVKIPHAVKQQGVRVLRLDLQVLLHHGRVGIRCFVSGSHGANLPQACCPQKDKKWDLRKTD